MPRAPASRSGATAPTRPDRPGGRGGPCADTAPARRRAGGSWGRLSPSAALEVALALPVVDDRVVHLLLDPSGVEVVVDDLLAEDLDRRIRSLELPDRLVHAARHALHALGDVAVALELVCELQPMLDAVQACADHRRVGEVGVHVTAREAVLDVEPVAVAHEPKARRPVVTAPDDIDRGPRQRGVALVGVDERRDEHGELAGQRHHPGDELAELLRHAVWEPG